MYGFKVNSAILMLIFNFKKQPLKTSSNKSAWCHPLIWLIPHLIVFYCKQNSQLTAGFFLTFEKKNQKPLEYKKTIRMFLKMGKKALQFC